MKYLTLLLIAFTQISCSSRIQFCDKFGSCQVVANQGKQGVSLYKESGLFDNTTESFTWEQLIVKYPNSKTEIIQLQYQATK